MGQTSTHEGTRPAIWGQVHTTLALAFAADPLIRWIFPSSESYLRHFPTMIDALGGGAFATDTVDTEDAGAALWLPPGVAPDEEGLLALIETAIAAERHAEMGELLEQADANHPHGPHWYLPFIGVEPHGQGQGIGSRLLEQGLARADRDGLPAYLEASTSRSRALYERHGFVVVAEIRAADSPPLWPMLRRPR